MANNEFIKELHFCYSEQMRQQYIAGSLGPQWRQRYPALFDDDDFRICQNQCKTGTHFYEWLTTILVFEALGYKSLIEKYGCDAHPAKLPIYKRLVPPEIQVLGERGGWPDLICYKPDLSDWFFCEVKGADDELRDKQIQLFRKLYKLTRRRVCVVYLRQLELTTR